MFLYPQKGDVISIKNYDKPLLVVESAQRINGLEQVCTSEGYITLDQVQSILSIASY